MITLNTLDEVSFCKSSFAGPAPKAISTRVVLDSSTHRYQSIRFRLLGAGSKDTLAVFARDADHPEGVALPTSTVGIDNGIEYEARIDSAKISGVASIFVVLFPVNHDCSLWDPIPIIELDSGSLK